MVASAIAYSASAFANSDPTGITRDMFTLAAFDTIGLGAAVSLIERRRPELLRPLASIWVCAAALFVLLSPLVLGEAFWPFHVYQSVFPVSLAVIVAGACVGYRGVLKRILEWPPLLYLGRISYGVFVYHYLVLEFAFRLTPGLSVEVGPVRFFWVSALTILAASLSWHAIEAPIARLKRFFPVQAAPAANAASARA
jgi:peptidoglycan/LPS O-acetylase OafA/YrhL